MLVAGLLPTTARTQTVYTGDGEPLAIEEEIRWHLNRARFDRSRENARRGTSFTDIPARSGPLAPHAALIRAARRHAEDLARTNRFQHETVPGSLYYNASTQRHPWDRMSAEGYDWNLAGENIAAGYTSGLSVYLGWWASTGHRRNMGNAQFREIGNGYFNRAASEYIDYYGMTLGQSGSARFFTDTLFFDSNSNGAYNQGEGLAGGRVLLLANGVLHGVCDLSGPSGSFAIPLQGIASGTTVSVVLENTTSQPVTFHLPRDASTLESLPLAAFSSRVCGRFVRSADNVGFRDLDPVPFFLHVSPGTRLHGPEGVATATVTIDSSSPWTVTSNAPWLRLLSSAEGSGAGTLTYSVDPHDFGDPRSAALVFTSQEHETTTFTVTQTGLPPQLETTTAQLSIASNGQANLQVAVTANVTWQASAPVHWLQVPAEPAMGSGLLRLDVAPNIGTQPREASVTISGGGLTRTVLVQQEPSAAPRIAQHLILDPSETIGTVIKVTGIPPGLVWDRSTGWLVGNPTRAGIYSLQVEALQPNGSLSKRTLTLQIQALPSHALGRFEARFDQVGPVAGGLGGETRFTVASTGLVSGVVQVQGRTWSFRDRLRVQPGAEPSLSLSLIYPDHLSAPLELQLTLLPGGLCAGAARVGDQTASLSGYQRAGLPASPPVPAMAVGRFHWLGEVGVAWRGDETIPQGLASVVLTVSQNGRVQWTGKLGDGTAVLRAGGLGPSGVTGLWLPAYRGQGSFKAEGQFTGNDRFQGTASWVKRGPSSTAERSYRNGFGQDLRGPVGLELTGERWLPLPSGQNLLSHLGLQGSEAWELSFHEGVMNDTTFTSPDRLLLLGANNRFSLPLPGQPGNEHHLRLTLNPRTGLLKGSFVLLDPAPDKPGTNLTRTVQFEGLLLPGSRLLGGRFIAPKRPDPNSSPPRTRTNSDQLAGAVTLRALLGP